MNTIEYANECARATIGYTQRVKEEKELKKRVERRVAKNMRVREREGGRNKKKKRRKNSIDPVCGL